MSPELIDTRGEKAPYSILWRLFHCSPCIKKFRASIIFAPNISSNESNSIYCTKRNICSIACKPGALCKSQMHV